MKRAKKVVSILVTLAMLVGLLLPVGTAFAFSKNSAKTVPTVKNDDGNTTLGTIVIAEDGSYNTDFGVGQTFNVTLPSGVKWLNSVSVTGGTYQISANDRTLTVTMGTMTAGTDRIEITTPVELDGFNGGDVVATIDAMDSAVKDGTVVIGKAIDGDSTVSATSVETVGLDSLSQEAGTIEIRESAAGSMSDGKATPKAKVVLELPTDFEWDLTNTVVQGLGGFANINNAAVTFDPADGKSERLTITFNYTPGQARGILQITPFINVPDDADLGEFKTTVSGEGITDTDVVIGKVADFGVALTAGDPEDLIAGETKQDVAEITLEQDVANSFISGRKVTFDFPSFVDVTSVKGSTVTNVFSSVPSTNAEDDNSVSFTVNATPASKAKITFEVSIKANAPAGDLKVAVKGNAGVKGEVVVGKVIPPVTATTSVKPSIKLGLSGQTAGDITLVEGKKGAIKTGDLLLVLPTDVEWNDEPTVEVTAGNLKVTKDNIKAVGSKLTIPIENDSTSASTIKVSGIKLDVKSIAFIGDLKVDVKGPAVAANHYENVANATKTDNGMFDQSKVTSVAIANAGGLATSNTAKFNIGSSVYYVGGAAKVMDAAPYIKENRTYVPVRYLAYALGVTEDNIKYENGVVTLTNGDKVVKLTIGSNNIDANGTVSAMDAAPEINNGRTMLPARFVAEALGAQVGFANGEVILVQ